MALRDLRKAIYTTAAGESFSVGMDAALLAQTDGATTPRPIVGRAQAASGDTTDPLPRDIKPRGVYVTNGTNRRFVVCLMTDAPLFTGAVTTCTLQVLGAAPATYTRLKAKSEFDRRRNRIAGV